MESIKAIKLCFHNGDVSCIRIGDKAYGKEVSKITISGNAAVYLFDRHDVTIASYHGVPFIAVYG